MRQQMGRNKLMLNFKVLYTCPDKIFSAYLGLVYDSDIKPLLEFINTVFSMLTTSTGLVIGCIVGLFVSYTVFVLLSGHEFQVILSALAYVASVFLGLVVKHHGGNKNEHLFS